MAIMGVDVSKYMPDFSGLGNSLVNIGIVIVVILLMGVVGYIIWDRTRYKYKIEVFENVGGAGFSKVGSDLAMVRKIGNQGEEILFLKKRKKIITSYNKKMGNNLLWFAIAQDGSWINCTLGDLDAKRGMLDIEPVDRDMRYAHVSLRKAFDNEFNKPKFMDKYGSLLFMGIFLVIMIIGIGYLINKIATVASSLAGTMDSARLVAELNQKVLVGLDNIKSGSGIKVG